MKEFLNYIFSYNLYDILYDYCNDTTKLSYDECELCKKEILKIESIFELKVYQIRNILEEHILDKAIRDHLLFQEKKSKQSSLIVENNSNNKITYGLGEFLKKEATLLSLIVANNKHDKIKLYSKDSLMFLCQFHYEKTPSMGVTNHNNLFYCYGCGETGTVINYLSSYEGLTYSQTLSLLQEIYLINNNNNKSVMFEEIADKYRKVLISQEYESIIYKSLERFEKNKNLDKTDYSKVTEGYEKSISVMERVRKNSFINIATHFEIK